MGGDKCIPLSWLHPPLPRNALAGLEARHHKKLQPETQNAHIQGKVGKY